MAYLAPTRYDDEEKRQQELQQPQPLASAPAPVASAAPAAGQTQAPAQAKPASQYPSLMTFVNANKEQGKAYADKLRGQVGDAVKGAQDERSAYNQTWGAGNEKAVGDWKTSNQNAYSAWQGQQNAERAQVEAQRKAMLGAMNRNAGHDFAGFDFLNPVTASVARDADKQINAKFNQQISDINARKFEATGLPGLATYSPDQAAAQRAQAQIDALKTPAGTAALLGKGGYSTGNNLDAAVLGQAAPGLGDEMASQYGSILQALQNPTAPTTPAANPNDWMTPAQKARARLGR